MLTAQGVKLLMRPQGVTKMEGFEGVTVQIVEVRAPTPGKRWKFVVSDGTSQCLAMVGHGGLFESKQAKKLSIVKIMNAMAQQVGDPPVTTVVVLRMEVLEKNVKQMVGKPVDYHEPSTPLRFRVGDRVECPTDTAWKPGVVTATWFRLPDWAAGYKCPYRVRFDGDDFDSSVSADDETTIRKSQIILPPKIDPPPAKKPNKWRLGLSLHVLRYARRRRNP